MLVIPVSAVPAQQMSINLAGQNCTIKLYQKTTGVFVDLYILGTPIITGVIVLDRVCIVRDAYLGFIGDLVMIDTQGTSDPDYSGFGARWQFCYVEASDL